MKGDEGEGGGGVGGQRGEDDGALINMLLVWRRKSLVCYKHKPANQHVFPRMMEDTLQGSTAHVRGQRQHPPHPPRNPHPHSRFTSEASDPDLLKSAWGVGWGAGAGGTVLCNPPLHLSCRVTQCSIAWQLACKRGRSKCVGGGGGQQEEEVRRKDEEVEDEGHSQS